MQFLVLGPLEVTVDGRAVALPAAKHRALLAVLLAHANQVVSAGGLIDALWDGHPPATAAKTLQTYVSQLRRELEPDAAAGDWRTLRTVDGGYRLYVGPDRLDASRFERLAADGRQALHRLEAASAAAWLREGLALWRGPAYGELADAPFARAEAARLEELRLAALEWRAEAELALGGHAELVGELEQLVGREPFREQLWGHLMLAQTGRAGRRRRSTPTGGSAAASPTSSASTPARSCAGERSGSSARTPRSTWPRRRPDRVMTGRACRRCSPPRRRHRWSAATPNWAGCGGRGRRPARPGTGWWWCPANPASASRAWPPSSPAWCWPSEARFWSAMPTRSPWPPISRSSRRSGSMRARPGWSPGCLRRSGPGWPCCCPPRSPVPSPRGLAEGT